MVSRGKQVLFLLFVLVVIIPFTFPTTTIPRKNGVELFSLYAKTTVRIFNHLGGEDFSVHCKSKDDDLGNHVIHDIECYSWEFHPNVFGTTSFSCNISSTRGEVNNVFYNQKRDRRNRCPDFCDWYVTKDGIEGFKVLVDRNGWEIGTKQDIIFKWDPCS